MIFSRSPVCAQALALLATSLLAVPHVAAESAQGELAARAPTPDRGGDGRGRPWQYSSFVAEKDLACCPAGTTPKEGTCCPEGTMCASKNGTASCIPIHTPTNGTNGTNSTTNNTASPSPTDIDSGAVSTATWSILSSVACLAAAVGLLSL